MGGIRAWQRLLEDKHWVSSLAPPPWMLLLDLAFPETPSHHQGEQGLLHRAWGGWHCPPRLSVLPEGDDVTTANSWAGGQRLREVADLPKGTQLVGSGGQGQASESLGCLVISGNVGCVPTFQSSGLGTQITGKPQVPCAPLFAGSYAHV